MSPSLHPDTPAGDPQKEDRLNRLSFARRLAHAILHLRTSDAFVFSLRGSWGSGKSTLLEFVLAELATFPDDERPVVVRFNPWWFSGSDELLLRFLEQLETALGHTRQNDQKSVGKLVSKLRLAMTPLKVIGAFVPIVAAAAGVAGDFTRDVEDLAGRMTCVPDVQKIRADLEESLRAAEIKILVVMDDLDRLAEDELKQMLQLVKGVAGLPNTIYLLAYDRQVVERVVPHGYMEKIVQVPFDLPAGSSQLLQDWFLEDLQKIMISAPEELWSANRWAALFTDGIAPLLATPRDVKRLLNSVVALFGAVSDEVNGVDFIALQALRTFAPEVYSAVEREPRLLCRSGLDIFDATGQQRRPGGLQGFTDDSGSIWAELSERADPGVRDPAEYILRMLFPPNGSKHENWSGDDWVQRRICHFDHFDLYFALEIPAADLGRSGALKVLATASDVAGFGLQLVNLASRRTDRGHSQLRTFLNIVLSEKMLIRLDAGRRSNILMALSVVADELLHRTDWDHDERAGVPDSIRIWFLAERILWQIGDYDGLVQAVLGVVANHQCIAFPALLARMTREQQQGGSNRLLAIPEIEGLEQATLAKIRSFAADGTLVDSPALPRILEDWQRLASAEEVQSWFSARLDDSTSFSKLLRAYRSPADGKLGLRRLEGVSGWSREGLGTRARAALDTPPPEGWDDVEPILLELAELQAPAAAAPREEASEI